MPSYCICCRAGERALRSCFWVWWYVGAAIPKVVETFVFVWPVYVVEAVLLHQWAEMVAGTLFGTLLSYGFFLPWANNTGSLSYPSGVCSIYVCAFSWVAGALVTSLLIDTKVIEPLRNRLFRDSCMCKRVRSGAWIGVSIGMSFAFSLTAYIHPVAAEQQPFEDWCRPHPQVPLPLVAVPISIFGAVAHIVNIPVSNDVAHRLDHIANSLNKPVLIPPPPHETAQPQRNFHRDLYVVGRDTSFSDTLHEDL